jgi:glycosyltransferase involved in cell wall biosynthesis
MRIALVTENFLPKLDGVTRTLAMLLEHLQRRGHAAMVLGPRGAPRRYAGARIYGARGLPLPFYPELRALLPSPSLERRLARFHPDIVHVAEPMLLGAMGVVWAQRLGVPLISSYHTNLAAYCAYFRLGMLETPVWAYRRMLHNSCDATLCPSPSTARELRDQAFERVMLWPRGVDGDLFHPSRRSLAWRLRILGDAGHCSDKQPIALYVGRLSHEKNLGALVEAWNAVRGRDARLVIVGDGPARGDLERALSSPAVTFTGYLRGEVLAEVYASSDLFVFPSRTETFGQVVLEAMASGLPVLGFDADGVRDLVRDGETGLLAPGEHPAAFARMLATLLDEPQLLAHMGLRGRAAAEQRTWAGVMDGLLADYARIIEQHAERQAA